MLVLSLVGFALVLLEAPATADTASITSAGPLTRVEISDQLNCAVDHVGDTEPEWFGDTACGTLLAVGGELFGPSSIPAGGSATPRTGWTPVSQSAVSGAGTSANPYRITTVVAAGTTGVQISQVDSYIVGEESYSTAVTVHNTSNAAVNGILYRAGDCFLQNSDNGYGEVDTATGAISCTADNTPGSRIEQMYPLTSGSHYMEDNFDTVWEAVGSRAQLPDTCECDVLQDNGIGLSWTVALAAGASKTYSSLVTFSPLGRTPLAVTKTADAGSVAAGANDGYTIHVSNNNVSAVTLETLTDTLPAGFSYRTGTTTGATTTDPTIVGQNLSWSGISVPAGGSISLHFGVTVSSTPGTYDNAADGTATGYTVVGTGPTAPVTVTAGQVNHAPVANDGTATTPQDTAKSVSLEASDADGDALTYAIVAGPAHGTLSGSGASRTYTPNAGYSGPDSFTFKANDGQADSNVATVSITVTPVTVVNHPPVAQNGSVTTQQNTPVGVTLHATDADGDSLSYAIVTGPAHGTLSGSGASRVYTPNAGYSGPDSFTFRANDGDANSNLATVSITVKAPVTAAVHSAHGSGKVRASRWSRVYCFSFNARKSGSTLSGGAWVGSGRRQFLGSRVTSMTVSGDVAVFKVAGKYKGRSGYTLKVTATDGSPDKASLVLKKGSTRIFGVSGKVFRGSLTVN